MTHEHWQIVLIDPDEDYRYLIAIWLGQAYGDSFTLHWLPEYAAAHAYLENHQPDLLILDYILDGGNGLELLKVLYPHGPHPPTLLFTAWDRHLIESNPALAGLVDAYVSKASFTIEELRQTIFRLLKNSSAGTRQL